MRDFGVEKNCVVCTDSTAALAIAKRKGAGKIRISAAFGSRSERNPNSLSCARFSVPRTQLT